MKCISFLFIWGINKITFFPGTLYLYLNKNVNINLNTVTMYSDIQLQNVINKWNLKDKCQKICCRFNMQKGLNSMEFTMFCSILYIHNWTKGDGWAPVKKTPLEVKAVVLLWFICRRQYMVRFDLDSGLDHMKANWYHSKFKQIWTPYLFEHHSNVVQSVQIWAASWQNRQCGCAPSEDSDKPGHPPSLIRVFAVRMKKAWVLNYPLSA